MSYNFEALGDERFQQLCQAILVKAFPKVQCLPVGQPDGGRDAFVKHSADLPQEEFIVFQVKYAKDPGTRDAREAILQVIKSERSKIDGLIARGATAYYLLTNVAGTAHPDVGSIDKLNKELTDALGIEAQCWWRDDLSRRIDANTSLKWSYPDIIRATDLLEALIQQNSDPHEQQRIESIRSFMSLQASYDDKLKFKQIDLQASIIDLFVDVPAQVILPTELKSKKAWVERFGDLEAAEYIMPAGQKYNDDDNEDYLAKAPGVLQLLASTGFTNHFPMIVIEGAPGQGKSTVTQFLCQIHRLKLLQRATELNRIVHTQKPTSARIPFRVDLRDYASWISGRDPFSSDPQMRLPLGVSPILENFLAAQVQNATGIEFKITDLNMIARRSRLLIVLDGFDEIADIASRNQVVSQVSDAAARLEPIALSAQFIVTSRPAAFANSPGFPRQQWQHIQILPLSHPAIQEYAQKWLVGRDWDRREKEEVLEVLKVKLRQAHVRDLARNPMQLAILLTLISVQGASLPDKRTALYDKYIDIFLNRESEKSLIVRDHRDLLVELHMYLAWRLQAEAETSAGVGHISESNLRSMIKYYLDARGHNVNILSDLFSGVFERVFVLVSRVVGTYEFEVQPLREYFAARYLKETAPLGFPIEGHKGALPDRFEALAGNLYWTNVARFFAGRYGSGELASLVLGLEDLSSSERFSTNSHPRQLGVTLLGDYVFSQMPRLAERVAKFIVEPRGFRVLLANRTEVWSSNGIVFPPGLARQVLLSACTEALISSIQIDTLYAMGTTIGANCSHDEAREIWIKLRASLRDDERWVRIGACLGIFDRMSALEFVELMGEIGHLGHLLVLEIFRSGRFDIIESFPEVQCQVINFILDSNGAVFAFARHIKNEHKLTNVLRLLALFSGEIYGGIVKLGSKKTLRTHFKRIGMSEWANINIEELLSVVGDQKPPMTLELISKLNRFLDLDGECLANDCSVWSDLIESAQSEFGFRWVFAPMAIAAVSITRASSDKDVSLSNQRIPLCIRAARAKSMIADVKWWSHEISLAMSSDELTRCFVLLIIHKWMAIDCLLDICEHLGVLINSLSEYSWNMLADTAFDFGPWEFNERKTSRSVRRQDLPLQMVPRLACFVMSQTNKKSVRLIYDLYLKNYIGDDHKVLNAKVWTVTTVAEEVGRKWMVALPVIAHAYEYGVIYNGMQPVHGQEKSSIPKNEALYIVSNPERFPLALIGAAEAVLAIYAGASVKPVGVVAEDDNWFSVI